MKSTTIIAFDQHAATTVAAVLLPGHRTPALHTLTSETPTVLRFVERLRKDGPVQCCYEAGPCGFDLQRGLAARQIPCDVIAPALIPRRAGDRIKTDRRDAGQLAVLYRAGAMLASADDLEITVEGKGTHGAAPWKGVDPIVVAAQIVLALQTIVTRTLDPLQSAVISVTRIGGGNAYNVIPEEVKLAGTVRAFSTEVQKTIERRMGEIVEGTCKMHGATGSLRYEYGYPPTINAATATPLEPGMVFCVETPYYEHPWGGVQVEDAVEITPGGARMLTRSSQDLQIVG